MADVNATEVFNLLERNALVGSVIIIENIITILILLLVPKLRTKTNMILLSLAVIDVITGIIMFGSPMIYQLMVK